MSHHGSNDMPGANAMGDTLAFVKQLWGSMKIPGMSIPSLSPEDIDKQIADLKAVESWLQVNMNMLRSSIQALEVQSATLAALRSVGESFAKAASGAGTSSAADDKPSFESPFQSPFDQATSSGAAPDPAAMAAPFANAAVWWNAMQEQFSNAVGQAMQQATPAEPKTSKKPTAKKASAAKPAASRKRAAKTASKNTAKGASRSTSKSTSKGTSSRTSQSASKGAGATESD